MTTELLETRTPDLLLQTQQEVLLLESPAAADVVELTRTQVLTEMPLQEVLLEVEPTTVLLSEGVQGPPGPVGPIGPTGGQAFTRVAGHTISALRAVWEDSHGAVHYLSPTDGEHIFCLVGVALTAADMGGMVNVQRSGVLEDSSWSWGAGQRVYLGADGVLTGQPAGQGFHVLIGVAVSPNRLLLHFQDPVMLDDIEEGAGNGNQ